MADNKQNLKAYYSQLAKLFKNPGPIQYQKIAHKVAGPGTTGMPIGTAQAFMKNAYNSFSSHMSQYGLYSRLARYSDYASMESLAEIAASLDIFADETCSKNEYGQLLSIESPNPKIKESLEELFYDTLNIEFNAWSWIRNLCKYGDQFLMVDHHPDYGVINALPMPVNEVEREEGYDEENPTAYRYRWITQGNKPMENWQVIHFRLLGNDAFLPYGASMIEPARRVWRQLCHASSSKVWVKSAGYKQIKDVRPADIILSFDEKEKKILETRVKKCSYMGKQSLVEVQTGHRKILVTPNHGLLVRDRKGEFYYKRADELICSEGKGGWSSDKADRLVLPSGWEFENDFHEVQLDKNLHTGNSAPRKICLSDGYFRTSPQFMRLFGFMFGDGWAKYNKIGFATGVEEERNRLYISLFQEIFNIKEYHEILPQENRGGQINFNSKELVNLFSALGFDSGYNNKVIPSWVFSLTRENKINFIRGVFDADGGYSDGRFASSNKTLIEQVKMLCQQSGVTVGREEILDREAGIYEDKCFGEIKKNTDSYRLYVNLENIEYEDYKLEIVNRVIPAGEDDTYDLEVDHEVHNFTVDGVVSHNTLLEDAVMVYRIVRSPERRVFYIDVGNIAPQDVTKYIEKVKTQLKRNQIVDSTTGRVDLRYNPLPVHAHTPIPLLDGRSIKIEDLAKEHENGKENWVYSIRDDDHQIVPGKVVWCGKNYTANKLIKVTLDDGGVVKTAPEHPFILRDGSSVRADQLEPEMSLMPLYRKTSKREDGMRIEGYDMVYDPKSESYKFTHRLIANSANKEQRENVRKNVCWEKNRNLTVHHIDFNKINNNPSNLKWMGNMDHFLEHSKVGTANIIKYNKSPEKRLKTIADNKKYKKAQKMGRKYDKSDLHKKHNEIRKNAQMKSWSRDKQSRSKAMEWKISDECIYLGMEIYKSNPSIRRDEFIELFKKDKKIRNILENDNRNFGRSIDKLCRYPLEKKLKSLVISGFAQYKKESINDVVGYKNHKVSSVEEISEIADVYCMTVIGPNGEEDRHNFAVADFNDPAKSLIFLKNSSDEDYFLPHRGDQGSKIETLPGGQFPVRKDSRIPLLDGRVITIEDLAKEFDSGKVNWVYSVQDSSNKFVPGKVIWCGKNYTCDKIHRVWLDDSAYVDTAPEHPFVMRDGTSKKAEDLVAGDSLMPFRTKLPPKKGKRPSGYWMINSWTEFAKNYLDASPRNHKVQKVEILTEVDDVYCMTVVGPDGEHDRHNFAMLSVGSEKDGEMNGIFVKNTGDIEDLQYFQNKLFAALKIPKSYLGYEGDVGAKSTLSQEDVRFARTIQRLQRVFVSELNKLAVIHLFSSEDIDKSEVTNFEISMANPSSISELQRLELWRTKFEVASVAAEGILDRHFIYSRLFQLSDNEIEGIYEGRKNDRLFEMTLESLQPEEEATPEEELPPEDEEPKSEPTPSGTPTAVPEPAGREAGLPPPPSETEKPITASRDPMRQVAAPNELMKGIKKKKHKSTMPNLYNHTFNTKKTAMDPKRNASELTRFVRNPFGESVEDDEEDKIFESNKRKLNKFVKELEENETFANKRQKKVITD